MTGHLDDLTRDQLDRDLANLPDLWQLLQAHSHELLAAGEPGTDDRRLRATADLDVIDLADTRNKWRHDYGDTGDQPARAEENRIWQARREGVPVTLASWVEFVWADADAPASIEPNTPHTIDGDCLWLRWHLDLIDTSRGVAEELPNEIRGMVHDLEQLVGDGTRWHDSTMTADQLAEHLGMTTSGIRNWVAAGYLTPLGRDGRRHVFSVRDAEAVKRSTSPLGRKPRQDARVGSLAWWK